MASAQRAAPEGRTDSPPAINIDLDCPDRDVIEQHLAPVDHGGAAWKLLGTAFVFEALLWGEPSFLLLLASVLIVPGFPLSFGVFQEYYSTVPEFSNSRYIPIVGTTASGISYLGAPLVTPLIKRFPKYQRHMIWVGCMMYLLLFRSIAHHLLGPICVLGLVIGSFATTLGTLIITQGVMYGIGFLIFYYPILNMVNEFWVSRRGMAYGLLCSASGVSGAIMPLILEKMLYRFGHQTTLRAVAVFLTLLTGPLIPFLKGRLPASEQSALSRVDSSFLKHPLFWVYSASNVIQGLGYFFPSIYLPSHAASIGLSHTQGAMLLALMSVSQVAGQFTFGYLSDKRLHLDLLVLLSTLSAATATLTLWGLGHSLGPLISFVLVYGFFGAGYVAMWARMSTAVSDDPTVMPMIFSLFCFGKGVGNVMAGPIGGALSAYLGFPGGHYSGTKHSAIIFFTGICMILSAVCIGGRQLRLCKIPVFT